MTRFHRRTQIANRLSFTAFVVCVGFSLPQQWATVNTIVALYYGCVVGFCVRSGARPARVMAIAPFWRWPRAFGLAYKTDAGVVRMICFPLAVVVIAKGALVLYCYFSEIFLGR